MPIIIMDTSSGNLSVKNLLVYVILFVQIKQQKFLEQFQIIHHTIFKTMLIKLLYNSCMQEHQNLQLSLLQSLKIKFKTQTSIRLPPLQSLEHSTLTRRAVSQHDLHNDAQNVVEEQLKHSRRSMEIERNVVGKQFCLICFSDVQLKQTRAIRICRHKFCKQCLQEYAKICINTFTIARCPKEECYEIIQADSSTIRELSTLQQQKYIEILVFFQTSKGTKTKICPTGDCKGIINVLLNPAKCEVCKQEFCSFCLLKFHNGICDQNVASLLHQDHRYQRCAHCKIMVEKIIGCHHITCKCGHQFCYACGVQWFPQHQCPQMIQFPLQIQHYRGYQPRYRQALGRRICSVLKKILKLLLISIFVIIVWAIFFPLDFPVFIVITLFRGIKETWESFRWYQILLGNIFLVLFCIAKITLKKGCSRSYQSLMKFYMPVASKLYDYIIYKLVLQYQD